MPWRETSPHGRADRLCEGLSVGSVRDDRAARPLRDQPHDGVHRMGTAVREALLEVRRRHPTWGPRKLLAWPAASRVGELLRREGLVRARGRRRRRESQPLRTEPRARAERPTSGRTRRSVNGRRLRSGDLLLASFPSACPSPSTPPTTSSVSSARKVPSASTASSPISGALLPVSGSDSRRRTMASGRWTSARKASRATTNARNNYSADVSPMLPVYLSPMSPAAQGRALRCPRSTFERVSPLASSLRLRRLGRDPRAWTRRLAALDRLPVGQPAAERGDLARAGQGGGLAQEAVHGASVLELDGADAERGRHARDEAPERLR